MSKPTPSAPDQPEVESVPRNRLLARLAPDDRARLVRATQAVQLRTGQELIPAGAPVEVIHFPDTAVASVVATMHDGMPVEVATIGVEGFVGLAAFLGTESLPMTVLVQVPGDAHRMDVALFRQAVESTPRLAALIHRYIQGLVVQIAQTVACNRLHPVLERTARWLLQTSDRVGRDEFRLTQEFLATMLGVHRPSVTVAAGKLQRAGCIRYHRGMVRITDRRGLEDVACECYGIIRAEFDRLLR